MSAPAIWNEAFRLALASASPTRRRLLEAAGLPFETVAADVDERAVEAASDFASPEMLAAALARAKALSAKAPGALVIGADQVLSLDGRVFHKSATREAALATLSRLAGRTHRLTSAFALARDGEIVAAESDVGGHDDAGARRQPRSRATSTRRGRRCSAASGSIILRVWARICSSGSSAITRPFSACRC